MGVRPVWDEKSGWVKGLDVIPLEELGRPRMKFLFQLFLQEFFNQCSIYGVMKEYFYQ
ncbi:cobaltochelatase subunit CobN [Desulfofundulus thermosubterraneus]|uniref:CobN/Magnesium Chelatase n=1 Tax=Desulfofundulus thermosubterraneus DSM 16057 TaxID=1121432 RepID=A0A1M6JUS6_9FIRM|nr:cobaltochelatase subunit CobN [Desulfofundulus thermosubterraneus]SHJ50370.1 CobN/Magnesium Chelatase [Desulfofundulus thermosubterraneus DSM 16057]